jgi:hypothetical protein
MYLYSLREEVKKSVPIHRDFEELGVVPGLNTTGNAREWGIDAACVFHTATPPHPQALDLDWARLPEQ